MSRINLTLHQLKVFMVVAQQGGFTSAAEELSSSQPGLTSAVRQKFVTGTFQRLKLSLKASSPA